ncbi:hypothetical protein RCL_jg24490.t1 [Rhizophagus clarus]|uniref:Uncharacterized protein n=1 Tax=Rhizophagus clarus TaxID=94130 RepID=A0A8H3MHV7_9GLOM|nr:hypothetical protein RCL_jg24490.t1 [Rhizophagus clarus]
MRFNSFLLLLATLFAVGSSLQHSALIQSTKDPKFFWAVDNDNIVLKSGTGTEWIVSVDIFSPTVSIIAPNHKAVTYNGPGKWFTLTNVTTEELLPSQRFQLSGAFHYNTPLFIQPRYDTSQVE